MRTKTLYYCPQDADMLLFEDIYDERVDFAYLPLHEIPQICPKCGVIYFKKDCITIEELFAGDPSCGPAREHSRHENP